MGVVVVESPAKAKTIEKYLGAGYTVLASYGHVRDLPPKDGSVDPEDDFRMTYQVDGRATRHLKEIAQALRKDPHLVLATDPDREGEAISWHVLQALRQDYGVRDIQVERVAFNEITKRAVGEAMRHPRELDMDLVNAQQARRALDYLVGFNLSPVLWRKLPGAKSAGRVQSVALRLICEREIEIDAFRPQEYWTIEALLKTEGGDTLTARLVSLNGSKLEKFSLPDEASAKAAVQAIERAALAVASVETKPAQRHPSPPFTTSTLQQEASRKLGFAARRTMQVAQRLYEGVDIGGETVGLITYMRTDGVQMADEAIANARRVIAGDFGQPYLPDKPRVYRAKAKNAQEAHEAIRPTDLARHPEAVARYLEDDQRRLYELVWKRALASQMASARLSRTTVEIAAADGSVGLRATGQVVDFPGFLKLYEEGRDDLSKEDRDAEDERRLPRVTKDERLAQEKVSPAQHFTEPPPRYSEATLVRKLEELGIGRPSTYATIISVLQDRGYVALEKRRFVLQDYGMLVTAFLVNFFERYVEYGFTADMETELDDVSGGRMDWRELLRRFWRPFRDQVGQASELRIRDVLDALDEFMAPHLYGDEQGRACPACKDGRLGLRLARGGAFLGCSNYPECKHTRPLAGDDGSAALAGSGTLELGEEPGTGKPIAIRKGPYGFYVQVGEAEGEEKPRRVKVPQDLPPESWSRDTILRLLTLPREIGTHPGSGETIRANIGRFGPYLETDGKTARLASTEEALTIGINHAVELIDRKGKMKRRELGSHPDGGKPIVIGSGRFGPYVQHGDTFANVPKGTRAEDVTLDEALELLRRKQERQAGKPAAGNGEPQPSPKRKAAAKKSSGSTKKAPKKAPKKAAPKRSTARRGKAAAE